MKKIISIMLVFTLVLTGISSGVKSEAAKKIRLNKKKATIYVGKKVKLKVKGTKKKVKWKSKNKKIATVSKKGVVRGKKKGKVWIQAKVAKKTLKCRVIVKDKKKTTKPTNSPTATPILNPTATATPENPTATQTPAEPTPTPEVPNAPTFSKASGEYEKAFALTLTGEEGSTIYYTTDGSIPLSKEEAEGKTVELKDEISVASDNMQFYSSNTNTFLTEAVEDGTKLTFGQRYTSVCFKVPVKVDGNSLTDWSGYDSIRIKYTVHNIGNSTKDTLGLQICPIYADATSSWNGTDTSADTTRVWDDSRNISGSGTLEYEFTDTQKSKLASSSVGSLMLGVNNDYETGSSWSGSDVITIHSIELYSSNGGNDGIPAKLDTNTYTGPIQIQNRDNEENVLCSETNIPYMYAPSVPYDGAYYPEETVPKATVIRAIAVRPDGTKSKVATKVYFVGKDLSETYKNASVLSLVTDPDNLLSKTTGIYRYGNWNNSGEEWERPADVTYIEEDGTIPFETTVGIRIHGGYTRTWGQKSFRLYFREEYGQKNLKYPLIPGATNFEKTETTTKYKRIILRNGGNDYKYTKLQDVWIQSLVEDRAYTTQSSRPCVLFLNGEYWGLYSLTERYNDNYLETEFGVDKDNVIVIKNGALDEGEETDLAYYEEMQNLAALDMSVEANYKKFTELVDEQSFLDYYATELYIGNKDWPYNNIQFWRTRTDDGTTYGDTKWRYMLFDTEYSMDLYGCDSGLGNVIDRTRENDSLFNAVCDNTGFQQKLANTIMELANKNFAVSTASAKLDTYIEIYRPLMEQYFARFGGKIGTFDTQVERLRTYITNRKAKMQEYINDSFGLTVQ